MSNLQTINTILKVNNKKPKVGIFNYDELSIKNKNNSDKIKTLNNLANFVKTQILENEFDLVVVCSQNSILRTENHIQHIISKTLEGTIYKLLSKMSINKKSIFNSFVKKINVRTRIWYNTNTINLPPLDFSVNMKKNENIVDFNDKYNDIKKMNIKLIERKKIYPDDTQKIKEGIGIIFTKIVISENTNQNGGEYKESPDINNKIHEFIIVNSNPPFLKTNNFSKTLLNTLIPKNKNPNNSHDINLIYISASDIKYTKLGSMINNLSYLDNNIYYYNLNVIIYVNKNKKNFIKKQLNNKITIINKLSAEENSLRDKKKNSNDQKNILRYEENILRVIENKKKKVSHLKVLLNSYGYLLEPNTLKNFNKKI
jgi:hypothetical protein